MQDRRRLIVIGASSGGLAALRLIAERLPGDLAVPILVVLHTGAHRSLLPEILNTRRPGQALFAQSGRSPEPGRIYVAPPDRHVLIEDGVLRLFGGPKEHHSRPAINPLFRSAALGYGRRAIGVVLTGMLDDGSAGLHAIKACGGTTIVQDPAEAVEPSMPLSALASTRVDHVVRLDEMAPLLAALASAEPVNAPVMPPEWLRAEHAVSTEGGGMDKLVTISNPTRFTCPDCGGALSELTQGQPPRFMCHTGHAFSLRSLVWAQGLSTDEALWSGLRASQEKEALLRRLAATQSGAEAAATLAEAGKLVEFIASIREVIGRAPVATLEPGSELPLPE